MSSLEVQIIYEKRKLTCQLKNLMESTHTITIFFTIRLKFQYYLYNDTNMFLDVFRLN